MTQSADFVYERALRQGMVEEGADPVYCIVSIQQLLDEAQTDHVIIEEVIVGKDSLFGLSRRYLYLLEKETLLRFPSGQVSLKSYEMEDPTEDSLEIVLGEDSRFLTLPAVMHHQWPEVFETQNPISGDLTEPDREESSSSDKLSADSSDLATVPVEEISVSQKPEQNGQQTATLQNLQKQPDASVSEDVVEPKASPPKKKTFVPILISAILILVLVGGGLFFVLSGSTSDQKSASSSSADESEQVYDLQTVEDLSDIILPRTEAYQDLIGKIQNGSGVTDAEIFEEQSSLLEALEKVKAFDETDNLLVKRAEDYLSLMHDNMTSFANAIKASGTTSQSLYQSALSEVSQVENAKSSFYTLLNAARTKLDLEPYEDLS